MPCAMSAVARTPRPVAAKSKSSIGGAANSDEQRIVRSARSRHRRRPEPPYNKEQWGLPRAEDPHSPAAPKTHSNSLQAARMWHGQTWHR